MVAGWPIAHHVWAGNEVDHTTVGKAIADLHRRFGFNRLVFVGDRGMVTSDNLDAITAGNHGYLVGLKRRRNKKLDRWLAAVDEAKWINCPVGITAREKADPPRTRAQEVPSGIAGMRVIIVDSDERRASEEAMRVKSMERTRQALEKLRLRRAAGKLKQPEKIGAAAERLLQRSHGYRYFPGTIRIWRPWPKSGRSRLTTAREVLQVQSLPTWDPKRWRREAALRATLRGRYHGVCADVQEPLRSGCAGQQSGREPQQPAAQLLLPAAAVGEGLLDVASVLPESPPVPAQ